MRMAGFSAPAVQNPSVVSVHGSRRATGKHTWFLSPAAGPIPGAQDPQRPIFSLSPCIVVRSIRLCPLFLLGRNVNIGRKW